MKRPPVVGLAVLWIGSVAAAAHCCTPAWVRASALPTGFFAIDTAPSRDPVWSPHKLYAVVAYVRGHLDKVGETRYFELYR